MKTLNLLALDLGASNGRGILGQFDGERVRLQELHRFENEYIQLHGTVYWDILRLFENAKAALGAAGKAGITLDAFGIDTWGVDYGLLDRNGRLLGNVIAYRNMTDADMERTWVEVSRRALFERTGIASMCFNTVYQLHQRKLCDDVVLEQAETLLFLPDLLAYFLTGEKRTEYTYATTSMLYDPLKRDWARDILAALGIPAHIFTDIQPAGSLRGKLLPAVAQELGLSAAVPFAAVGEHDTASAVAAIPGAGNLAFCSSGTWSLFGVETDTPVFSEDVYAANFSNEGTVQGGFRPLKNIMGLWIIQECRRDWNRQGQGLGWDDIVRAAEVAEPFRSLIDPDWPAFFMAGGMEGKIRDYCVQTGQPAPETVGQVARCVYESLALKYRWTLERLEAIKGGRIDSLHIVGGGSKNRLLNRMAAGAIHRPVVAGPVEGAAMGNILLQAVALGELSGIDDVRRVVRSSAEIEEYLPLDAQAWEDAYGRLLAYMAAQ